jgi:NAD-dependent SIR2 family protein deacetylase
MDELKPGYETVAVFGAGASKNAGGLLLGDVLPAGLSASKRAREDWGAATSAREARWANIVRSFLATVFAVDLPRARKDTLPDIGMILSMLDMAISQGRGFVSVPSIDGGPAETARDERKIWTLYDLMRLRENLDGMMSEVILKGYYNQFKFLQNSSIDGLTPLDAFSHEIFLDYLADLGTRFSLISLNYDMFLDRAACQHLALLRSGGFDADIVTPRYDVDFEPPYVEPRDARLLHKLHGSLDWAYCTGCGRAELLFTQRYIDEMVGSQSEETQKALKTPRSLESFYDRLMDEGQSDNCSSCGTPLKPMIIAPTLVKNYANAHIRRIWSHAERALMNCKQVVFIGYSLPVDDLEFIWMLKRSTQHLERPDIHVITSDQAAQRRFESLFGRGITVYPKTFSDFLSDRSGKITSFHDYEDYATHRAQALAAH